MFKLLLLAITFHFTLATAGQALAKKKKAHPENKAFIVLKLDVVKYKDLEARPYASFSAGGKVGNIAALGFGAGIMKSFAGPNNYCPLFFHITGFPTIRKGVPYFSLQIGLGMYNYKHSGSTTTGGLFFSPAIGMALPGKGTGAIITLSYLNSAFRTTTPLGARHVERYNIKGFSAGIGIKLGY